MKLYRWAGLISALLITIPVMFLPAYVGITLPDLDIETGERHFSGTSLEDAVYHVLDIYYLLFILLNLTPFVTFVLWSFFARARERKNRKKAKRSKGSQSDLFSEKTHPRVSVIIPCYNESKYVGEAITNAYRQTYPGEIEIIVVDDGSKDNTWYIGRIFQGSRDKRTVKVIHKPNSGKASALRKGAGEASGKIIITTDGDSRMDKDAVREIVECFRTHPDAGIVGGFVSIENTHEGYIVKLQQLEYVITQHLIRLNQSDDGSVLIAPGPIFGIRGDIAKKLPPLDRTIVEDCDLTMSILPTGMTTRSTMNAVSHTNAPTTWRAWGNQRRRWIYGQFQAWRENRWHLKKNLWGLYTYLTWVSTTLSALILLTSFFITGIFLINGSDYYRFIEFVSVRSLFILIIYALSRVSILMIYGNSRKLIHYLPLKVIYDMINGFLTAYLYIRYITRIGIRMGWRERKEVVH